jgi:hypothetical protein
MGGEGGMSENSKIECETKWGMKHWSTLPGLSDSMPLELHHDWGCFCQAGDNGIVFTRIGSYRTAFFEAFPEDPNTFIRGEGKDIVEAEENAWVQFEKIKNCKEHEFERKGYRNGGGFCKNCGLFSVVFEPLEKCCICGVPTYYTYDKDDNWYCPEHERLMLPDKYTDIKWHMIYSEAEIWDWEAREV